MDPNRLDGLIALKWVAERRNFSAAAAELQVSPSAVSQAIQRLESRLGVALLSRTTRSTSLTEAGEQFLHRAGPALDQILLALDEVGNYAEKPRGLLRLNVPMQIYATLAPILASFTKEYPDVTVELFLEDQQSDVVESGFDAGIRLSDILAKDMVATKVCGPVRFVTAAAPSYWKKFGRPKHPEDLLTHNCIRVRIGRSRLYDRWEFESRGRAFEVQVKGSLILNDSLLSLDAAVDGMGVAYATQDSIRSDVEAGKLEVVLDAFAPSSEGYYLYYPKRTQALPKLRAFSEHIRRFRNKAQ